MPARLWERRQRPDWHHGSAPNLHYR